MDYVLGSPKATEVQCSNPKAKSPNLYFCTLSGHG